MNAARQGARVLRESLRVFSRRGARFLAAAVAFDALHRAINVLRGIDLESVDARRSGCSAQVFFLGARVGAALTPPQR